MRKRFLQTLVLLSLGAFSLGNVAAPWHACSAKKPGDPCAWGYGCQNNGICTLQAEPCKDNPQTPVNECLICKVR